MKNLGIFAFIFLFIFSSCRKEVNTIDIDTSTPDPTIVDAWTQEINNVTGSVVGLVVDENEKPIAGVTISLINSLTTTPVGSLTTTTDELGYFFFNNETLNSLGTYITAEQSGFMTGSRRFFPIENEDNRVKIKLIEKIFGQQMDSQTGGTISIGSDATVDFTGNSFVLENGDIYNGTVHFATKYLDPTAPATLDQMPGNLQGVNILEEEVALATYGMIALEMEGDNGEPLNILPDNPATIKVKVPNSLLANAPSEIPLWFFDETIGMWVEEGNATLQNDQYVGEVKHFTFWNCDAPFPLVEVTFQIITTNDKWLPNVKVQLSLKDLLSEPNVVIGYTDENGYVSGKVPEGEVLNLTIYDQCDNEIFTKEVGPFDATSNATQLVLVPASSLNIAKITGRLIDCDGDNVVNGGLIIKDGNKSSYHKITGGNFSIETVTCNRDARLEIIGVNEDEQLQSAPFEAISGRTNPLGDISVCEFTFIPISEAGFEPDDPAALACGTQLDGRDCWRNPDIGGVVQITSNPVHNGDRAGKLPSDGTRIGYQRIEVEPNTEYTLSFYYTMKDDNPAGTLTVSILDDSILTDPSQVPGAVIASTTVNDQTDPTAYVMADFVFNSGANSVIAIYFNNEGVECRLDDFLMVEN